MIKKIVIKNLNSAKSIALGKIKFYDCYGDLIDSGSVVKDTALIGETENFKCYVNGSYIGLNPINMIDTNTESGYWVCNSYDRTIEIYFKKYIDSISKISIVPLPGKFVSNGVTGTFDIDVYDYDDNIIQTYKVTPISEREMEQDIITNELTNFYITSDMDIINTTESIRVENINKIRCVQVDQVEPNNTNIRYLFSIDNKSTWFTIKDGTIQTASINNIMTEGMTKSEIENIFDYVFDNIASLDIMVGMNTTSIYHTPILRKILVYYI